MSAPLPPPERYVYDIPVRKPYAISSMLEYVFDDTTSGLDRISRIHYCENIPELPPNDREYFRERIAHIYTYQSKVHNDKNFSPDLLISYIPHYEKYLHDVPPINVSWEKFKSMPDMAPAFNGTGCVIL